MRYIFFIGFIFLSLTVSAQHDSSYQKANHAKVDSALKAIDSINKKKSDSAYFYPDSVKFQIPARLMQAYLEVTHGNSDGILVGQLKEIIALTEQQSNKQLVKKPKK